MTIKQMNKLIREIIEKSEQLQEEFEAYIREAADAEAGKGGSNEGD